MENTDDLRKKQRCFGCLCLSDKNIVQKYKLRNEHLRSIFQTSDINLCSLCKRIAQKAELFIQNVQGNQILIENMQNMNDATVQLVMTQTQPIVQLSVCKVCNLDCDGSKQYNSEAPFLIISDCTYTKNLKLKKEIKEEDNTLPDQLEDEFVDNAVYDLEVSLVKEKVEFPFDVPLKEELAGESDNVDLKCRRKTIQKTKAKRKVKTKKIVKNPIKKLLQVRTFNITREECMQERVKMLQDKIYQNCTFKCEDCIKGFSFKGSYDKHMEKHSESNGEYVCDVCKQRLSSEEKLLSHKRSHEIRYMCGKCDFTRMTRLTIMNHYLVAHGTGFQQYRCTQCPKVFNRKVSLKKHVYYLHTDKKRVVCTYCHKSYANNDVLKSHMITMHSKAMGCVPLNRHICQDCGKAFKAPSQLKKHSLKHSRRKDFYCVECDKHFSSDSVLKQHLKIASPHVNYSELPLMCVECDKRFAIKRDLERHNNRVHLNVRPHKCDRCNKAYVNNWSLKEHQRLVHEGYKRPLRFPCTFCDKVFTRNQILKSHLRTHTGERPYQCSKCPAHFNQGSVLATHVRLIHLKQTRDGKPKTENTK